MVVEVYPEVVVVNIGGVGVVVVSLVTVDVVVVMRGGVVVVIENEVIGGVESVVVRIGFVVVGSVVVFTMLLAVRVSVASVVCVEDALLPLLIPWSVVIPVVSAVDMVWVLSEVVSACIGSCDVVCTVVSSGYAELEESTLLLSPMCREGRFCSASAEPMTTIARHATAIR